MRCDARLFLPERSQTIIRGEKLGSGRLVEVELIVWP